MTDQELIGIAAQALNMAKLDRERSGLNFLFGAVYEGEGLHRLRDVEQLTIAKLGEDWLNSGARKDAGFAALRLCLLLTRGTKGEPQAVAFVSPMNLFEPTKKFFELARAEQQALLNPPGGHRDHHRMVKEGWYVLKDGLAAIVQTPERVCTATLVSGEERAQSGCFPASEFEGRMKLYGEPTELELEAMAVLAKAFAAQKEKTG